MLALGLRVTHGRHFWGSGDGPVGARCRRSTRQGSNRSRDMSPDYFTLEQLVALHPDFPFAGWNYGLEAGTNLTPADLAKSASRPWS